MPNIKESSTYRWALAVDMGVYFLFVESWSSNQAPIFTHNYEAAIVFDDWWECFNFLKKHLYDAGKHKVTSTNMHSLVPVRLEYVTTVEERLGDVVKLNILLKANQP